MSRLSELNISYVGVKDPETHEEIELEVAGLDLAIRAAEKRKALLKQSVLITQYVEKHREPKNAENVEADKNASKTEPKG